MGMKIPLNELKVGQTATVTELYVKGSIRRRLRDIGLISGTAVECLFKSPGGDPTAYKIRDAVIAIRNDDASKIAVAVN